MNKALTVPTIHLLKNKNTTKLLEQTFNCILLKVFRCIASTKKAKKKNLRLQLNYTKNPETVKCINLCLDMEPKHMSN